MVTIEEFLSLDIRVGRITHVETHQAAKKPMYLLKIDFGAELGERTIIAGIKPWYTEEELRGKKIACVVNLEPKKIAGHESQGMILAADGVDTVSVLVPLRDVPEGSKVH